MTVLLQKFQIFSSDCLTDMIAESVNTGFLAVQRLADEWASGVNRFNRNGEALFIAKRDNCIIGVCGLNIDSYATNSATGRVRHLYVMLEHRRRGIGRVLVERVVDEASLNFDRLHLRTHSDVADRFYRAIGFTPHYGDEYCTHTLQVKAERVRLVQSNCAFMVDVADCNHNRSDPQSSRF